MTLRTASLFVLTLALNATVPSAQERPLPDQGAFLAETRRHLQLDSTLQSSYVYQETRRRLTIDPDGHTQEQSVKILESYPGLPGEDRWERLIAENGIMLPARDRANQDRDRQQKAAAIAARQLADPEKERIQRQREEDKDRRELDGILNDLFQVYDIRMTGREKIEGHDTIAFALSPRAGAKPATKEGGQMTHFRVNAWISETDHELVKVEAEALDNVSIALGGLARLNKGAQLSFTRRKVNGEVWLPASVNYNASVRVGLIFTTRRNGSSEFSNYRKYVVGTSSTFSDSK
jgi:hypothetical protein